MIFRFPLATVMRLREIAKLREERLLGQILTQLAQCRVTLSELDSQTEHLSNIYEAALKSRTSAAELHLVLQQISLVKERQSGGRAQVAKLELLQSEQMKMYETAHRNHELLSLMRERQSESFRREATRLEQNAMDDTFSSRRSPR